ncbi:CvpA family protein [Acetobacter estunensis]|uniref:CvpA family protein n=1 Tax=Acetobacter estunensis TaxID=104097 RepID=UPI001C2D255D|nr:CvpA family protein [Acetobacter estunensis]MBV1837277.1 CvpA family protein [Acetobacter estunensis]
MSAPDWYAQTAAQYVPDWATIGGAVSAASQAVAVNPLGAPAVVVEVVLVVSLLLGLRKGLSRAVLGLGGWVAALLAALAWHHAARQWAIPTVQPAELAESVAFGVVFLAVLLGWALVSSWVARLILASPLAGVDRLLGGVFGLVKGGALIVALYIVSGWVLSSVAKTASFSDETRPTGGIASAAPYIAPWMSRFAPTGLAQGDRPRHDLRKPEAPGNADPD